MKVLLLINGKEGSQMGIEDGFEYLRTNGQISELKWFYFEDYAKKNTYNSSLTKISEISLLFKPNLIIFFHIGYLPVDKRFIYELKSIPSNPIIVYDEGDMYGGWSKPININMKNLFKYSDYISIRGLGKWYKMVKKYNSNIIFTPHSNSLYRFTKEIVIDININKKNDLIFIGNRVNSKLGRIRRLSGAYEREKFVNNISKTFNNNFKLFGNGWSKNISNNGILDFYKQTDICKEALIQVSYEHYPHIPYYFSDRLPIALASGQIYVCHYHLGYENIFKDCDFIYFFTNTDESIDIINYLFSLDAETLLKKSYSAKEFADKYLSPLYVWSNFFNNISK